MQENKMVGQLVERIRNKDQRAMSQLYQMYVEELSSVCYRYVSSESDAKDVLQNSFVKIFTSLSTFEYRDEPSFHHWMMKVVVNEALHFLKDRKRLSFVDIQEAFAETEDDPATERITSDELHQLISELPDGCRMVLNLFIFEGYSHKMIAELLNMTESTSASQLFFAKRLLAKRINELMNKRR